MRYFFKFFSLFFIFLLLSCKDKTIVEGSIIDPDLNLSRKEFSDLMNIKNPKNSDSSTMELYNRNTPPNISKLLVAPPPPPMGNGDLISFAVTEEIPINGEPLGNAVFNSCNYLYFLFKIIIFYLILFLTNLSTYLCSQIFQFLKAFPPFFEIFIAFFLFFRCIKIYFIFQIKE